jgi:tellurite methyltransferase
MTAPIWDMLYSNKANSLWGDSHCILYEQILPHIGSRASILDLGCGAGRNSVPFVSAGHSVLGIDNSAAAVEAFRSRIARTGLIAELLNDDVQQFHFIRSYNAILAHGILHLIELRNRQTLIAQMKAHTLRHGYNVVVVMTSKSDIPAAPAPKYYPFTLANSSITTTIGLQAIKTLIIWSRGINFRIGVTSTAL